jgi:hypothetical protein
LNSRKALVQLLSVANLTLAIVYIYKVFYSDIPLLDDSFIYLHIANNIVETRSAQYFPISDSWALLASSPLRLFLLVPGVLLQHLVKGDWNRSLSGAHFAWICSSVVSFFLFFTFWRKNIASYLLLTLGFWLINLALPSALLMEGALIYLVGITFIYLLKVKRDNPNLLALITILAILTRPEFGLLVFVTSMIAMISRRQIQVWIKSLLVSFGVYSFVCVLLHVYPIPTTILSKDLTSRLKLFSGQNLLGSLPQTFSHILFSSTNEVYGFAVLIFVCLFCLASLVVTRPKGWPIIPAAFLWLTFVAGRMPYFAWYSENYFVVMLLILVGTFYLVQDTKIVNLQYGTALVLVMCFSLMLISSLNRQTMWPWNEGSGRYTAYESIGNNSVGGGSYQMTPIGDEEVHIRMCEIGLVAYFSGNESWIFDSCGLAQPGELLTRTTSPLRFLYPDNVLKTGSQEQSKVMAITGELLPIFDFWGLDIPPIDGNNLGCDYVDVKAFLCINRFTR